MEKRRNSRSSPQALQGLEIQWRKPQNTLRKMPTVRRQAGEHIPKTDNRMFSKGKFLNRCKEVKGKMEVEGSDFET